MTTFPPFFQGVLDKLSSEETETYPACVAAVTEMCRSASLILHDHWSAIDAAITKTLLPVQDGKFSTVQDVSATEAPLSTDD